MWPMLWEFPSALYNREFKFDDKVNISAEDKDVDVTIATDDHNRDFSKGKT